MASQLNNIGVMSYILYQQDYSVDANGLKTLGSVVEVSNGTVVVPPGLHMLDMNTFGSDQINLTVPAAPVSLNFSGASLLTGVHIEKDNFAFLDGHAKSLDPNRAVGAGLFNTGFTATNF